MALQELDAALSRVEMKALANGCFKARPFGAKAAPFVMVGFSAVAARTSLASHHPLLAALLFLWIAADTMMLALLARISGKPDWHAVLGVLAGAGFTVWLCSPSSIREAVRATPAIMAGMAVVVLGHVAWGTARARRVLAAPGNDMRERWTAAVSEILPGALVRFAATELNVIHMALFRWSGRPDAPENSRAFTYHKHLAPTAVTLLALSAVELTVLHLLVGHKNRAATTGLFILSDAGFLYLLGLVKSFRFRPILLTPHGVRIRAGLLTDQFIPLEAISKIETRFTSDAVRDPAALNVALLSSWPNILLRLNHPIRRPSHFRREGPFNSVAFRLDDPDLFARLLRWRLGQQAGAA